MNQVFNSYSMAGMGNTMNYDMSKTYAAAQPDSLFSMALYEFEAAHHQQQNLAQQAAEPPKRPGHFYPVDEYKDLSLREILDISDDFLFDDVDAAPAVHPMAPVSSSEAPALQSLAPPPTQTFPTAAMTFDSTFSVVEPSASDLHLSPKKRSREDLETEEENSDDNERRFRPYQAGQWSEKFAELCTYREKMGHCLVPHTFSENLPLARWVKRQRYQYKLMREGKASTMTEERVKALEDIGFVWDSQGAAWGERLAELRQYAQEFGHCNVPSNYAQNPQLATWVKCQRRQYKLHQEGKASNMTPQRIHELESLSFEWELRSYKKARIA